MKQTTTETYIGLDSEHLYVTLREDPLVQKSCVFTLRPSSLTETELKDGSKVYIETSNEKYV
jgi:exonuclease VII large subunit